MYAPHHLRAFAPELLVGSTTGMETIILDYTINASPTTRALELFILYYFTNF